jgi:hypothetical protein
LLVLATFWALDATTGTSLPVGLFARPMASAPLLIAQAPTDPRPAIRVVFQAVLGGARSDFFHSFRINRIYVIYVHIIFTFLAFCGWLEKSRGRPDRAVVILAIASFFLVFLWLMGLCVLFWEYRQSRLAKQTGEVERWGLTALLELARGWPRNRSQRIDAVFVAAGGQRLDFAGSRAVLRMLESEWPSKPSLLVLLFAPGAGERLRPPKNPLRVAGMYHSGKELAKEAAESLWIPVQSNDNLSLGLYWPFERAKVTEAIALIGSDPRAHFDALVSPEALQRATQLATEIALRWAKQKSAEADLPRVSSPKSEEPNKRSNETP